jgi:hypothetical protein
VAAASKTADGKVGSKPGLEEGVHRLAAIAGTSTCHIAQSDEGILVPGVVSWLSDINVTLKAKLTDNSVGPIPRCHLPLVVDERRRAILDWSTD